MFHSDKLRPSICSSIHRDRLWSPKLRPSICSSIHRDRLWSPGCHVLATREWQYCLSWKITDSKWQLHGCILIILVLTYFKTGGAFVFVVSLGAWYLFAAQILEAVDFPIVLPVGDLSNVIKGRSTRAESRDLQVPA
jgi:hypothetical protein